MSVVSQEIKKAPGPSEAYEEAEVRPVEGMRAMHPSADFEWCFRLRRQTDVRHVRGLHVPVIEKVAIGVEVVRLAQFVIDEADDHVEVLFALVRAVGNRPLVA